MVNDAPHFGCILGSTFFEKVASVDSQDEILLDKSTGNCINTYYQEYVKTAIILWELVYIN